MHESALYRKYRPKSFDEVIGQDQVTKVLESSIQTGKLAHAYLFVGSRGTGKTSVARIFARELGTSDNDIYEIDAASNRGINEIKELIEGVRVLPFDSKYKIYIIDEVHMLSKDAFNALLKTIEEPPKHAIFILATTELHKVLETIISRCQVFTFKKPSDLILKQMLIDVAKAEGYTLDSGSAELIAILGDGSFRDAQGVLQKVLNFATGKKITREDVEKITGAPKTTLVNEYIAAITGRDLEAGIQTIRKAAEANLDMKLFLKLTIAKFRMAVILKSAPKLEDTLAGDLSGEDIVFLKELAAKDEPGKKGMIHSDTLMTLLHAYQDVDRAFISELPLELALIKTLG